MTNKESTLKYASENQITNAIITEFAKSFSDYSNLDVIIIGGGPSGLMAGRELAKKNVKVLIVERNNYLGGGFWVGGYLMNTITIRAPGQKILDELGIPYKQFTDNLYVAVGPHACSKLISEACAAGANIQNMTSFDDVVIREENKVSGVVINWTPVSAMPREITCVDPVALECKIVIDSTGHDACVVNKLVDRKILEIPGFGPMWVERSEDLVVEHTSEVHPGLIVTGMAVSTTYGLPRMGPTFSSMLMSGRKGAEIAYELLQKY
ncbi:sulfide-dependent adenosine diphosphate thiazole synthase [[Eubacterium] cellulosolvens]